MRIELSIKADDSLVSFSHQHLLVGTLQKWLGENDMHGKSISYSFSVYGSNCRLRPLSKPLYIRARRQLNGFNTKSAIEKSL